MQARAGRTKNHGQSERMRGFKICALRSKGEGIDEGAVRFYRAEVYERSWKKRER